MKRLLNAFSPSDRYIITACHGPACVHGTLGGSTRSRRTDLFKGYEICVCSRRS
ncbi:hypothetical protein P4110_11220 [Pseudomonas aeruginosa]|nr:hypothetical protein [Pseudomonas aeruginosa]